MKKRIVSLLTLVIAVLYLTSLTSALVLSEITFTVETDKPEYYKGEEVTISGWLKEDGIGVPFSGVCINVTDPDDALIFGYCQITNDSGYYQSTIDIEDDALFGVYNVEAHSTDFDIYADTTFMVINGIPSAPTIDGQVNGNAGVEYEYTFTSADPNNDDIYLWVVWGDGCPAVEWIGPYESGEEIVLTHTFEKKGTYTISAKTKDIYDDESDWGYLEVSMPTNTAFSMPLLSHLFQKLLCRFPLLKQIFF